MTTTNFHTIIIGAGAAGLMTAITAARKGVNNVLLLDASEKPGLKILMSGGGRCNITNAELELSRYSGEKPNAIKKIIYQFPPESVVEFFHSLGVKTKTEAPWNKIFPITDDAKTVLNSLLNEIKKHKELTFSFPEKVQSFEPIESGWKVITNKQTIYSRKLVLANGGFSYPHTGSDGALWKNIKTFIPDIVAPYPALTPLKTSNKNYHQLAGITHWVKLKVYQDQQLVMEENNSLLITHDGISGPAALNVSQWFTTATQSKLLIQWIPNLPEEKFQELWVLYQQKNPSRFLETFLCEYIPDRLATYFCHLLNLSDMRMNQITKHHRHLFLQKLYRDELTISGNSGFGKAEVTGGGIPFSALNLKTMEVKNFPGLHAVGEIINVHGIIGGYNFQWAWSSGFVCGRGLET